MSANRAPTPKSSDRRYMLDKSPNMLPHRARIEVVELDDGTWGVFQYRRWAFVEPNHLNGDAPIYFEPGDYELGFSSRVMAEHMLSRIVAASWRGEGAES